MAHYESSKYDAKGQGELIRDGNEPWPVLIGASLFGAFPMVYQMATPQAAPRRAM